MDTGQSPVPLDHLHWGWSNFESINQDSSGLPTSVMTLFFTLSGSGLWWWLHIPGVLVRVESTPVYLNFLIFTDACKFPQKGSTGPHIIFFVKFYGRTGSPRTAFKMFRYNMTWFSFFVPDSLSSTSVKLFALWIKKIMCTFSEIQRKSLYLRFRNIQEWCTNWIFERSLERS